MLYLNWSDGSGRVTLQVRRLESGDSCQRYHLSVPSSTAASHVPTSIKVRVEGNQGRVGAGETAGSVCSARGAIPGAADSARRWRLSSHQHNPHKPINAAVSTA